LDHLPGRNITATNTHTGCVILIAFPKTNGRTNAPHVMFIHTSSVLSHPTVPYTMIIKEDLSTTVQRMERETNHSTQSAETKTV